jgi:hypothetical protein
MNIALEQTEEHVNGTVTNRYGDAFIRGNNGPSFASASAGTLLAPLPSPDVFVHANSTLYISCRTLVKPSSLLQLAGMQCRTILCQVGWLISFTLLAMLFYDKILRLWSEFLVQ